MQQRFFSLILILSSIAAFAQAPAKKPTKDEVYHAMATVIISQSDSPISTVKNVLGETLDVGDSTINPKDGKATVNVKDKNDGDKSIPMIFALQPDGLWKWEQFKNDFKFYPVERLFPYAKGELTASRKSVDTVYNQYLQAETNYGDAAFKLLDTAKAVLKKAPEAFAPLNIAREAYKKAQDSKEPDQVKNAIRDLKTSIEPLAHLADENEALKTNDAFLRLSSELEGAKNRTSSARKDYFTRIENYHAKLNQFPFILVAYGLGFTKIEPLLEPEQ